MMGHSDLRRSAHRTRQGSSRQGRRRHQRVRRSGWHRRRVRQAGRAVPPKRGQGDV